MLWSVALCLGTRQQPAVTALDDILDQRENLRMLHRGRHEGCKPRQAGIVAAVRAPQREVRMVPLHLPDEQQAAAALSAVPLNGSRQQRGGVDNQGNGAQGVPLPRPTALQERQRTASGAATADRPAWQQRQRQTGAAPSAAPASNISNGSSNGAAMHQSAQGATAQRMASAAQPQVESAAGAAAGILTQQPSGQIMVEVESPESGGQQQWQSMEQGIRICVPGVF